MDRGFSHSNVFNNKCDSIDSYIPSVFRDSVSFNGYTFDCSIKNCNSLYYLFIVNEDNPQGGLKDLKIVSDDLSDLKSKFISYCNSNYVDSSYRFTLCNIFTKCEVSFNGNLPEGHTYENLIDNMVLFLTNELEGIFKHKYNKVVFHNLIKSDIESDNGERFKLFRKLCLGSSDDYIIKVFNEYLSMYLGDDSIDKNLYKDINNINTCIDYLTRNRFDFDGWYLCNKIGMNHYSIEHSSGKKILFSCGYVKGCKSIL